LSSFTNDYKRDKIRREVVKRGWQMKKIAIIACSLAVTLVAWGSWASDLHEAVTRHDLQTVFSDN